MRYGAAAVIPGRSVAVESRYARHLQECGSSRNLAEGRRVHDELRSAGYGGSSYLQRCVLQMYARCGSLDDARATFEYIQDKNDFVWNLMISGYARAGKNREALDLFHGMDIQPNGFVFASVLAACAGLGDLEQGRRIHRKIRGTISSKDVVVQNALVTMYARCGSVEEGMKMFDSMEKKNLVSWNAMISAFVQCDSPDQALELYRRMQKEKLEPNGFVFASLLTACASTGNLELGCSIHQRITSLGLQRDIVTDNALINMYSKCGCMDDAKEVFFRLVKKDVFTWTSMIAGYAQLGLGDEAFELYSRMRQDQTAPTSATFAALLSAASTLEQGRDLHEQVKSFGFESDVVVETALMFMYSRCGSLDDAELLFAGMQRRDSVSWSAMVTSHAQYGDPGQALILFKQMILEGVQLSSPTFCSALQACSLKRDSQTNRMIHELIDWAGMDKIDSVRADLVYAYSKCGDMEEARKIFDRMQIRDVLTWTAMIKGYAQQGDAKVALELFKRMTTEGVEPDRVAVAEAIMACGIEGEFEQGMAFAFAAGEDSRLQPIGNALLSLHIKCGSVKHAARVFDEIREKDVVTWTLMLECYSQQQQQEEGDQDWSTDAFRVYHGMLLEGEEPTCSSYAAVVSSCSAQTFERGRGVHKRIVQCQLEHLPDVAIALVNMYCKCGSEQEIREIFSRTRQQSKVVMWNAVIAAYNRHDRGHDAIKVYREMVLEGVVPSVVTFMTVLSSCARVGDLQTGRQIHTRALACGMLPDFVKNALITMYGRCSAMDEARQVFDSVDEKGTVTWTALIGGCVAAGNGSEALALYKQMNVEPDEVTFASVLQACSNLEDGKAVHSRILLAAQAQGGGKVSDFLGNGLISMYARCGGMRDAAQIFESMDKSSRISWSAIMTLCARHGHHGDIIDTFRLMVNEGVSPDGISLIAILNSCSHAGLTDDACRYFTWITSDFGLPHMDDHYQCLVDLLCRAGRLDEAEELVGLIQRPDEVTLNTMLAACKNHRDLDRGARTAVQMQRSTDSSAAPFVLLSQIYAAEPPTPCSSH